MITRRIKHGMAILTIDMIDAVYQIFQVASKGWGQSSGSGIAC
jgi:hypothetical protein